MCSPLGLVWVFSNPSLIKPYLLPFFASIFSPTSVPITSILWSHPFTPYYLPLIIIFPEAWCWVYYLLQPTCSGSLEFRLLCVTFKVHHGLALYHVSNFNFHYSCSYTQWVNQTENSWSFLQCSQIFPPLFLFLISEEDVSSTLQMKLVHTLRSNSIVICYQRFPDFSHSQQEIIVFSEFWSCLSLVILYFVWLFLYTSISVAL